MEKRQQQSRENRTNRGRDYKKEGKNRKNFYNSRVQRRKNSEDYPKCPICGKPIRDMYAAVAYSESKVPAHFDCVLKELKKTNELKPNEKICYLGNGSFGIVQFRGPESPIRFFVRKRIQYESKEEKPKWREKLPIKLTS